jgi:hypothetical protein
MCFCKIFEKLKNQSNLVEIFFDSDEDFLAKNCLIMLIERSRIDYSGLGGFRVGSPNRGKNDQI